MIDKVSAIEPGEFPRRIASLLASSTEILFLLGLGDRVVAVSHECDHPAEAASRPRVTTVNLDASSSSADIDAAVRDMTSSGRPLYTIDVERLSALRPELIVTQSHCDVCAISLDDVLGAVARVESLRGCQVLSMNPSRVGDVLRDIRRIARAAGVASRGDEVATGLSFRIDHVRRASAEIPPSDRPRVLCVEWIDPLMVAANWMPELVDWAGASCPLTRAGDRSGYTSWDDVLRFDPQVIVVAPCGFELARSRSDAAMLRRLPGWAELNAVRHGRVWAADGNAYFNRSGPRLVDSLEMLAHAVHPERFARPACFDEAMTRLN